MEGAWKHLKTWLNNHGGTRDYMIRERLGEYAFFTEYIHPRNRTRSEVKRARTIAWWRIMRVIGEYGMRAKEWIENDREERMARDADSDDDVDGGDNDNGGDNDDDDDEQQMDMDDNE